MLRRNKTFVKTKSLEFEDSYYDEDFEEIEEDFDGIDGQLIEGLTAYASPSPHSETSSKTQTSDSPTKNESSASESPNLAGGDFGFDDDDDYPDNEDFSRSFDLNSFHDALAGMSISRPKVYKNGTRSSLTFSNERVREIERHNQLLLKKIMQNGPSDEGVVVKKKTKPKTQKQTARTSAEFNRRKQQAKIDYENAILKKKLDKIAVRRPSLL